VRDGENGLLVPPADSEALAQALEKVLTNREMRRRMGQSSLAKVTPYSWASTADRYLEISEAILRQPDRQPVNLDRFEEGYEN
jgi:glycosyltransferase involved in cell wall biosynthesis